MCKLTTANGLSIQILMNVNKILIYVMRMLSVGTLREATHAIATLATLRMELSVVSNIENALKCRT